jgi:hypothetical protein
MAKVSCGKVCKELLRRSFVPVLEISGDERRLAGSTLKWIFKLCSLVFIRG